MIYEYSQYKQIIIKGNTSNKFDNNILEESRGKRYNKDNIIEMIHLNESNRVKIFGNKFKDNNKNKCKIIYKNKKYNLKEDIEEEKKNKYIILKLQFLEDFSSLDSMFEGCKSLVYLSVLSNIKTNKVQSMENLFYGCSSLKNLPDISNWDLKNVTNIKGMFYGCSKLKNLPDISNWNTKNVNNISYLFYGCSQLQSLPDLYNWDINNVRDISYMLNIIKNNNGERKENKHRIENQNNKNNEYKKNESEEGDINENEEDEQKNHIKALQPNKINKYSDLNNINIIGNNNISQEKNNNLDFYKMANAKTEKPKRRTNKAYLSMNKVFFNDYQQKFVNYQKIKDSELNNLKSEIEKEINEGKFVLKDYSQNYIEYNVIPIFKNNKLNNAQFEALKYNIEKILECCGLPKNYYLNAIYKQKKIANEIDRNKSIDALKKFRLEFGISEKDYCDEGIIKRLEENELDINKTFQKMFG